MNFREKLIAKITNSENHNLINFNLGKLFDLYIIENDVKTLFDSPEFSQKYDSFFEFICKYLSFQENDYFDLVIDILDFLIYVRNLDIIIIEPQKYKVKLVGRVLENIDNLYKSNLDNQSKLFFISNIYCLIEEILKNHFPKKKLYEIINKIGLESKDKSQNQLFKDIVSNYSLNKSSNNSFKNLLNDNGFRNAIFHGDFIPGENEIIYFYNGLENKLNFEEISIRIKGLAIGLQFFAYFHLRLFQ